MKVATIVGTRPEIIRLSRVMTALDRYAEHLIIHTGQNYDYELNQVFFDDLEIRKPDYFLDAAGTTAAETIGLVIARSDAVLRETDTGRCADFGRYQQLSGRDRRQTPQDSRFSHGGRQSLF